MKPDDFRRLAAAGLTTDQIAVVMEIMERETAVYTEADEARKAAGRERWRKWKANQNDTSNVSKREPTLANDSKRLTRAEDKTSNLDIEPQKKEKGAKRASRLPSDWTLPVEWRVDALEAGLTDSQIDIQAATMRDWSRSAPKGAKTDWRAAWRNWCRRSAEDARARAGPAKVPQMADVFTFIGNQGNEPETTDDSEGIRPAVSYLSAVGSGRGS